MRVLIVQPFPQLHKFLQFRATTILLDALRQHGIEWTQINPREVSVDLTKYDIALFHNFGYFFSQALERNYVDLYTKLYYIFKDRSFPFLPSTDSFVAYHSYCLDRWHQNNIPCPGFQVLGRSRNTVELEYPLVLRRNRKMLRGADMFLVNSHKEFHQTRKNHRRPLDLLTVYHNTQHPDGYYRKRRCIVIGDDVHPRQAQLSPDWKVKLNRVPPEILGKQIEEDKRFMEEGETEENKQILVNASNAVGLEAGAIDYVILPNGKMLLFETNRCFGLAGASDTKASEEFRLVTGRTKKEVLKQFDALGESYVKLIKSKVPK